MLDYTKIRQLVQSDDSGERKEAISKIESKFKNFADTDKGQAWKDLLTLTKDEDSNVRKGAADALTPAFRYIPDKEQASKDLLILTKDKDNSVRRGAASALAPAFQYVPDKEQAWKDLLALTKDEDTSVRMSAASALVSVFQYIPDKEQASKDLLALTKSEDSSVRRGATSALVPAFQYVPDKEQASKDLLALTKDTDSSVRWGAVNALVPAFQYIPDKEQASKDLLALTKDKDSNVRRSAVNALAPAFQYMTDKEQTSKDLLALTKDKDSSVRRSAVNALVPAFQYMTDKEQAWKNLLALTKDKNSNVRRSAVNALVPAFQYMADKEQTSKDLLALTKDEDRYVRMSANYSLGKISIYRATEAESEKILKEEMDKAIGYFEKSSQEFIYFNPAKFCLPFYRSYNAVISRKEDAKEEIERNLVEAKQAVAGSENKGKLLEVIQNLANALEEAQKLKGLDEIQSDLSTYMTYCNRAAELLKSTEEYAPIATELIKKGLLPIIDERIRGIIGEIQGHAKEIYTHTRDTPLNDLGVKTCNQAKELSSQNPQEVDFGLGQIINVAKDLCEHIRYDDKKRGVCEKLESIENMEFREKVKNISEVFEDISKNLCMPRIQTIPICDTQEKIVRVAVIQLTYNLSKTFPFVVKNIDSVKENIFSGLDIAKNNGTNIACLPELCLCEEWVPEIQANYKDMIIIGGGYYKDNRNICPVIINSDFILPPQSKITPAGPEDPEMWEPGMISGDRIYKFETQFGKFVILICRDFERFAHYFRESDIDFIFCPAFNDANERFHVEANNHVTKTPSYILIANTGVYGGSSIFGQLDNRHFYRLVGEGCKDEGDLSFKICEAKKLKDEVIIADFNLVHKSIQKPVSSESSIEKRSIMKIKKIPIIPSKISNIME